MRISRIYVHIYILLYTQVKVYIYTYIMGHLKATTSSDYTEAESPAHSGGSGEGRPGILHLATGSLTTLSYTSASQPRTHHSLARTHTFP